VEKDQFTHAVFTSIKANAWSTAVVRIRNFENITGQKFDNNISVLLQVSVEYHVTYGLKLNVHDVDTSFTIGNLEKQKLATLQMLVDQNPGFIEFADREYSTFNKRLPLNPVIQRIALIASPNSDGYNDFKHELQHNNYGYAFTLDEYPAQVQGAGMEAGIVKKLVEIFISNIPYDAVVIVRGGGSQTDFLIFDSYEVGKAIARFPVPVFTGIGHTRNESIADMMAFSATKTPTKVAESIIAHNRVFEEKLLACEKIIFSKANELIAANLLMVSQAKAAVHAASADTIQEHGRMVVSLSAAIKELAIKIVYDQQQEITDHTGRVKRAADTQFSNAKNRLQNYSQLIKHLSPASVLKRGFALVYQEGKLVTSANDIRVGLGITTLLSDATVGSTITFINKEHE
jgi:exodeoxyribonuclease VII large subunit